MRIKALLSRPSQWYRLGTMAQVEVARERRSRVNTNKGYPVLCYDA